MHGGMQSLNHDIKYTAAVDTVISMGISQGLTRLQTTGKLTPYIIHSATSLIWKVMRGREE